MKLEYSTPKLEHFTLDASDLLSMSVVFVPDDNETWDSDNISV